MLIYIIKNNKKDQNEENPAIHKNTEYCAGIHPNIEQNSMILNKITPIYSNVDIIFLYYFYNNLIEYNSFQKSNL